jgi:type IV pilus assembly protein PilQ
MISSRTLVSAFAVALGASAIHTAAAVVPAVSARATEPNDATVTALSVVAASGRADVVIRVDGSITLKHFTLSKPDKIVVDLSGASLGLPTGASYDGVARGGIRGIRYSQFTRTVVRVVVTLDAPHDYDVTQRDGAVHIAIQGSADSFAPWSLGDDAASETLARVTPDDSAVDAAPAPPAPAPASATRPSTVLRQAGSPVKHTTREPLVAAHQQSQEPRITVNWENASISEVLGIFASFTGRTILPSKSVTGTVTANIVNLPWDVALKEVMNANGYDVSVNPDGVIVIDTFENIAARQATVPLQTRNVRLNYARSTAVKPMVEVRLTRNCPPSPAYSAGQAPGIVQPETPGQPAVQQPQAPSFGTVQSLQCPARGAVVADTITNSISITDVPSALNDLEQYARSLDIRQPQVNIKAKIILVDRTTLEGLGLRYDIGSPKQFFNDIVPRLDSAGNPLTTAGQILLGGNTISAIANASLRVPNAALQLVYSTALGNFDFTTFLEALQTNTLLDVQAEPSASVLNNRTANLTAGTQVPIRVIDAGSAAGNVSSAPRAAVQMQQTGIILTVTPQITNNRQVQMKVHVENSDVQFQSNDVGAVFPRQSVDNEMLVADGETMVVGGLTQTSVTVSRSGLPLLVDLPIIGRLFGVTNRSETKRDLLILITPHIIDEGATPGTGRP